MNNKMNNKIMDKFCIFKKSEISGEQKSECKRRNAGYTRTSRLFIALMSAVMIIFAGSAVFADEVTITDDDEPYLSLGADLTESEQKTVLDLFGINSSDLSNYDVHYVTNDEEYKYLGDYVDSSEIGSRALSSVVITAGDSDDINITTYNITYCTEGMYRNALTTAGVSGVDMIAAGPFNISGTAALVGTIKAYENMTGEEIDDDVIEGAVDEMTTTGEVAESTGDSDAVEGIIATVKDEMADNSDMSEEEIEEAVKDAADDADVDLSDENIEKITKMLSNLQDLDVDWGNIKKQSKSILEHFDNIFSEENKEAAKNIFTRFIDWIKGLIG